MSIDYDVIDVNRPPPKTSIGSGLRPPRTSGLSRLPVHFVSGCPTLRLSICGLYSRTLQPQQPSVLRALWTAHCHLKELIRLAMAVTFLRTYILISDYYFFDYSEVKPYFENFDNNYYYKGFTLE